MQNYPACKDLRKYQREKKLSLEFANNKSADRSAHLPILISTSAVHLCCKLGTSEISIFYLDSVAEQESLGTT